MAAREELRAVIIGEDRASDAFSRAGRSVSEMGAKMDAAAFRSAMLDDALKRQAETARRTTDATLSLAKSDDILAEVERRLRDGALEAEFALKKEEEALKKVRREADLLHDKHVKVKVEVDRSAWGKIGNVLTLGGFLSPSGGIGGGGNWFTRGPLNTGGASGIVGTLFSNPYILGGAAAGATLAAPLLGQLLAGGTVLGLGGGLAGLGIAGAFGTGKTVTPAQMTAAQDALRAAQLRVAAAQAAAAKKPGAASQATLASAQGSVLTAQAKLAQLQNDAQNPAQLQLRRSFASLSNDAQDSLAQIGKSFIPVMQSVFNTADSVLKKMTPVFAAAERTIAGPFKIFSDTLISSFAQPAVKNSIQAVAGSFGLLLKALTPQLGGDVAQVADGISRIARSVADHPQAFADFIKGFFKLTGIALDGISALANFGGYLQQHFWPAMHRTSVIFDGVRHETAHIAGDMASALIRTYEALWNTLIGSTIRFGHNVETQWNSVTHEIAVVFDGMRGQLGRIYNSFWNDTIGTTIRFGHNIETQFNSITGSIVGFFQRLPGRITGALGNAGSLLLNWGAGVISGLVKGMGSVIGSVWNFIKGIPGQILHYLHIASPPQWAIDAGRHIMNGLGIGMSQAQARLQVATASFRKSVANQVASNFGGVPGTSGNVIGWITAALKATGSPMSWLAPLEVLVSKESGGNPYAVNRQSVFGENATGLFQTLPSTFAQFATVAGGIFNPIANAVAGIRYLTARYGSPFNIPGLLSGHYVGYGYGTASAAPGWAWVGERGPELMHFRGGEQVVPARGPAAPGGAAVVIENLNLYAPVGSNAKDIGRELAAFLGAHIKAGGRLYPAGTTPR